MQWNHFDPFRWLFVKFRCTQKLESRIYFRFCSTPKLFSSVRQTNCLSFYLINTVLAYINCISHWLICEWITVGYWFCKIHLTIAKCNWVDFLRNTGHNFTIASQFNYPLYSTEFVIQFVKISPNLGGCLCFDHHAEKMCGRVRVVKSICS